MQHIHLILCALFQAFALGQLERNANGARAPGGTELEQL